MEIGWIGVGRMRLPMAALLLKARRRLKVWNRTRSKAEPLAVQGAELVDHIDQLRSADVVMTMLATGKDLAEVYFGGGGLAADGASRGPRIIVDCSTIGFDESSGIRWRLATRGVDYLAAPVGGNPKCVLAGKLSSVLSGPKAAFDKVKPLITVFALRGVAYVGEGELARVCKIAHNVFLAVVSENLIEVTLLAQKAGAPRHAFLQFIDNSVMGSIFTQYKSPALVNLDSTPTFIAPLQRKDVDLGLDAARKLGVAMPVAAATREVLQTHLGLAAQRPDPDAYLAKDFAALFETLADAERLGNLR